MSCANIYQAANQAGDLLSKSLTGARRGGKKEHIERAGKIAGVIYRRFRLCPRGWKQKHILWYLQHYLRNHSAKTRYDHYRTIRFLTTALGRTDDWPVINNGPWVRPTGVGGELGMGRPTLKIRPRVNEEF